MKKDEIRAFLMLFYRKRTSSFLANIYKASITGDAKDIHRARLDVKKIIAFYEFFAILAPKTGKPGTRGKLFRPLFQSAGKIREIQVHYLLLDTAGLREVVPGEFLSWLRMEEHAATKSFIRTIKKFDEEKLAGIEKEIAKACTGGSIIKYRSRSHKFLIRKSRSISEILNSEINDKSLHQIRKHLKTMSTVSAMVYALKPDTALDRIITAMNKTEMLIGEWHDRVVLEDSITRFMNSPVKETGINMKKMALLKQLVTEQKLHYVQPFMTEIHNVVESVQVEIEQRMR